MSYLVIGGTGTISGGIAEEELRRGHSVTVVNRGSRNYRIPVGVKVIHADINDENMMTRIIEQNDYDVVVDPLVTEVGQLQRHLSLFDGRCGKYVFISSCCAFGGNSETSITESHPMSPQSKYGINKLACENYLRKHKLHSNYLIIRPYITYGDIRIPIPFACRSNPYTVIDRIEKEKPMICFDIINHRTFHNLMDIRDFSRITVSLMSQNYINTSYNVCGEEIYTWTQAYDCLYEAVGKPMHLYYVDRDLYKYIDQHLYEDIIYDKDCDGTIYSGEKAKNDADDSDKQISLQKGISDLVVYLRKNCSHLPLEESFNYRTDLLLVNGVEEPDSYLRGYLESLDERYRNKLENDWKKLRRKYYIKKIPFVPLMYRVYSKIKKTIMNHKSTHGLKSNNEGAE